MRDMANNIQLPPAIPKRLRLFRIRPWVQTAFLAVWFGPFGLRLLSIPGCVFHCYACPLASFACPVGVVAQFTALHIVPLMALGVVVTVAMLVGSLVCGWACPFGFLQDLLAKIPTPKFRLPGWTSYGRYIVLLALVLAVPYFWGEGHPLFICRVCPAGALEGAVPYMAKQAAAGKTVEWMSWYKALILGAFLIGSLFIYRPWCRMLCPLGGFFAFFNHMSFFHLRFKADNCTECNLCRSRCSTGVQVERAVNVSRCIRCMECTACGAIEPAISSSAGNPPTSSSL